jgi:MFS family permease
VFAWLPSYFHRHGGVGPAEAGAQAGIVVLVAGIGAIAWGYVADRLAPAMPRARLHVPVAGVLASAALLALAFGAMGPGPLQYAAILAGAFAMTAALGPVTTVAVDVVPAAWRATSAGLLSLAQNLFGFASGPLVAGWLSDAYGLPFALAAVPVCGVAAAALFALAASGYERDLARVSREVDGGNLVPMIGR